MGPMVQGASATELRRFKAQEEGNSEFWAINDLSFDIQPGKVVGIIGRNGAGKSTLLKILSRITEPTKGDVIINGRVGSLLEVGTGFHPDLTGRENIFMNGTILGMKKREIASKFDEIVAFSEIEQFIDTPVKRYSSGMYVRLAFAVAAHLEPEILVVDEVLAVGDLKFQRKCLGKMGEVARGGRTVLLVSHNIGVISQLCQDVLWLSNGRTNQFGPAEAVCDAYLSEASDATKKEISNDNRRGNGSIRLKSFHFEDRERKVIPVVSEGQNIRIVLECEAQADLKDVDVSISLLTFDNQTFFSNYSSYQGKFFTSQKGLNTFSFSIDNFPFKAGRYRVGARIVVNDVEADWPMYGIGVIDVVPGNFYPHDRTAKHGYGLVMIRGDWEIEPT
jgi:lipopolysaccharide transport system ATP-binding protein